MTPTDTAIAVFDDHIAAEAAVRELARSGFDVKHLSVVGKGYHSEEKVAGFFNLGDRVKFWGSWGAFWGALWGFFLGGMLLVVPVFGHVVVLGYLASAVVSAVEGAVAVGGLSAIGGALAGIGVPNNSIIRFETALKADSFMVMAHGSSEEIARARETLQDARAASVDVFGTAGALA